MIKIAIYCVTYKSYAQWEMFATSIQKAAENADSKVQVSVFLADNTDVSTEEIDATYKAFNLEVFPFHKNLGYFGAVAKMMESTHPEVFDYVMISNVDLIMSDDFFANLSNIQLPDDAGWIAPSLYSLYEQRDKNPRMMQRYTKRKLNTLLWLYRHPWANTIYESVVYKIKNKINSSLNQGTVTESPIYAGHGSFIILTARYIREAGIINYPPFLYCEELYLAETCAEKGLKVYYKPSLKLTDKEHVSTSNMHRDFYYKCNMEAISFIIKKFYAIVCLLFCLSFTACSTDNETDDTPDVVVPSSFFTNNPLPQNVETLRILSISNSFSLDPTYYIDELAEAAGISKDRYCIYVAYKSNSGFKEWEKAINTSEEIKLMHQAGSLGMNDSGTLVDILKQPWDIIVTHQVSSSAQDYSSFNPYLRTIITQSLTNCTNPQVALAWQLVWSYGYGNTSRWNALCNATKKQVTYDGIDIVIPTGTAIQNAREKNFAGQDLTRDGKHLAYGVAQYIAACTWFEKLFEPAFGVSIIGLPVTHPLTKYEQTSSQNDNARDVDDSNRELCQQCVADAIAIPYKINQ